MGGRVSDVAGTELTVVVVAAGLGTRLGGENKVWRTVQGRPVWWWAASRFSGLVKGAVVVMGEDRVLEAEALSPSLPFPTYVVVGGRERSESSAIGLRYVRTPYVAVHDAARPLVSRSLIERVLQAALITGAAVPGLVAADTIKRVEAGLVMETLPRASVILAQTPQIFRTDWVLDALKTSPAPVTDDVSWLEQAGYPVAVVEGEPDNRKITTAEDWEWLQSQFRGSP